MRPFTRPSWMPQLQPPTVPLVIDPFSAEEVEAVIDRTRSNSSPSPLDQVPCTVLKSAHPLCLPCFTFTTHAGRLMLPRRLGRWVPFTCWGSPKLQASVVIFNTVMNTLVDTITKNYPDLGYSLASHGRTNLLQFADDTSLIADGPSSCQTLLSATDAWLDWSGMKANVSKCVSLAVRASSGEAFDPKLALSSEPIPYIGTSTFRFLGAPISIHSSSNQTREALC